MERETKELDGIPRERAKVGVLRQPNKPTVTSIALTTREWIALLLAILGLASVLERGYWLAIARDRVDLEIGRHTTPIYDRLNDHETRYVTSKDFGVHVEQEVQVREELRGMVWFIYQEAYRQRHGTLPPITNLEPPSNIPKLERGPSRPPNRPGGP